MKTFTWISVSAMAAVLTLAVGFGYRELSAQPSGPYKLSDADKYHLQAVLMHLDQLQKEANPDIEAKSEIVTRNCAAAKLPTDNCHIDTQSGTVTAIKQEPSKQAPAKK